MTVYIISTWAWGMTEVIAVCLNKQNAEDFVKRKNAALRSEGTYDVEYYSTEYEVTESVDD